MREVNEKKWWTAAKAARLQRHSRQDAADTRESGLPGIQTAGRSNKARAKQLGFAFEQARVFVPDNHKQEPVRWTPHKYQLKACQFILGKEGAGLFLDPGLGKTSIVLAAITALKKQKQPHRTLIVAPLRVCHMTWPAEQQKWTDFAGLSVAVLHGTKKDQILQGKEDIHIINPEGLAWLWSRLGRGKWPYEVLVIDESTKFKSWSALRTKSLRMHLHRFNRRWILTGTPAPNSIADLFPQIFLLDHGQRLGKYITHFRSQYMVQAGFNGYEWKPQKNAIPRIEAAIKDIVMRLDAKDWLELPDLIPVDIPVELPKKARRQYDELEKEFILMLGDSEVSAMQASTLGMKLRQVTNGYVYDEDGVTHEIHDEKTTALVDLVEELSGEPVLVGVAFLSEVAAIRLRLGVHTPYLGGGVSKKEAAAIVERWNRGEIPVLLAHPASVSHGLNLQGACRHVCWYGQTWNLEEDDQFIKRVHRQGNPYKQVIVHRIVAVDTKDQAISAALRNKDRTQQSLLAALKRK